MQLLLLVLLVVTQAYAVASLNNQVRNSDTSASEDHTQNIFFNVPSITVQYLMPGLGGSVVSLEAYKLSRSRTKKTKWVSLGFPYIKDGEKFKTGPQELTLNVRLLDDDQKSALVKQARQLFPNSSVGEDDINLLPLDSLTCVGSFHIDSIDYVLHGTSYESGRYDVPVTFPLVAGSPKRRALERFLATNPKEPILFECEILATGERVAQNTLHINSLKVNVEKLGSKLLGPDSGQKAVTRDQMTQFAHEVSTVFNVEEEYEIEGADFAEEFISQVLGMAENAFKEEPFEDALGRLSQYGMTDSQKSLEPSVITRELSDVLTVRTTANKDQVITVRDKSAKGTMDTDVKTSVSGKIGIPDVADAGAASSYTVNHGSKWASERKSVKDQLSDINKNAGDNVKFAFEGKKIVPKFLSVARVTKVQLSNTFEFNHIKKRISAGAKFSRTFAVSTIRGAFFGSEWTIFRNRMITGRELFETQKAHLEAAKTEANELKAKSTAELKAVDDVLKNGPVEGPKKTAWTTLPGHVTQISAKRSQVYAITENYHVIRWESGKWVSAILYGTQVSATGDNAWTVWLKGELKTFRSVPDGTNLRYHRVGEEEVYVAGYDKVNAIGIRPNGTIYRHVNEDWNWKEMPPIGAYEVSMGDNNEIWAIDFNNAVHRYENDKWVRMPVTAKHIDVQSHDKVVITDFDHVVYKRTGQSWQKVDGQKCVQASIDYKFIYCVSPKNTVHRIPV